MCYAWGVMLHRTSDVLHKTLPTSLDRDLWAAAKSVLSSGFCLCENLPTHDDVDRPCPKHAPDAYMVWEYAIGRVPSVEKTSFLPILLIVYKDENRQLHRIDGLPALIAVGVCGHVQAKQFYVRGERATDEVHLMDRLYWDL